MREEFLRAKTRVIFLEPRGGSIRVKDEFLNDRTHVNPHDIVVWMAEKAEVDSFTITFKMEGRTPVGWQSKSTAGSDDGSTRDVLGVVHSSRPPRHSDAAVYPYSVTMIPKGGGDPLFLDPELVIDPMD